MAENKTNKIEREYIIPLRDKCRPVPIYKKTPKAVKTVKEFLAKHMKVEDRDLNKVKLDKILNEALWFRGIRKPIHKIKVRAVKEGDIVRAYALDLPAKLQFKQTREEKNSKIQQQAAKEAQKAMEEARKQAEAEEKAQEVDADKDGVEDKVEEKEKAKAVEEVAETEAKAEAKAEKHTTQPKSPKEVKNLEKTQNKSSRGQ